MKTIKEDLVLAHWNTKVSYRGIFNLLKIVTATNKLIFYTEIGRGFPNRVK